MLIINHTNTIVVLLRTCRGEEEESRTPRGHAKLGGWVIMKIIIYKMICSIATTVINHTNVIAVCISVSAASTRGKKAAGQGGNCQSPRRCGASRRKHLRRRSMCIYMYIYQVLLVYRPALALPRLRKPFESSGDGRVGRQEYGQFSEFHVCFCGLDSGTLKLETIRTNKQHICFYDLRRSIWNLAIWNYENWQ